MTHVVLTRNLAQFTGGKSELELEAANIRQLLGLLGARFPLLEPHLKEGCRGRDRRRDLSGCLAGADPARQRGAPDPAHRRRVVGLAAAAVAAVATAAGPWI